jgi:hypothetical protein
MATYPLTTKRAAARDPERHERWQRNPFVRGITLVSPVVGVICIIVGLTA